ncbi:unnamed protein product [Cuscuta europaea]|uniref:Uncharacterized protein n=1 Tax=Cuscuta europaea TaxID=41803 RepID=A0A9P1E467_CUSEU|nr:unnamed protein product [Cuscuta europaea]
MTILEFDKKVTGFLLLPFFKHEWPMPCFYICAGTKDHMSREDLPIVAIASDESHCIHRPPQTDPHLALPFPLTSISLEECRHRCSKAGGVPSSLLQGSTVSTPWVCRRCFGPR